jgi:carbamate kinase
LLAIEIGADALLIATDVDAAYADSVTPEHRPIHSATPGELPASAFAAGSMGPTIRAACWFAERTGNLAAIRSTTETQALLRGQAGTHVTVEAAVPTG